MIYSKKDISEIVTKHSHTKEKCLTRLTTFIKDVVTYDPDLKSMYIDTAMYGYRATKTYDPMGTNPLAVNGAIDKKDIDYFTTDAGIKELHYLGYRVNKTPVMVSERMLEQGEESRPVYPPEYNIEISWS